MIHTGVHRFVIEFNAVGEARTLNEGAMFTSVDDQPHVSTDQIVLWTLDEGRLRELLAAAGADPDAVDSAVLSLEAAALASKDETEDDDEVPIYEDAEDDEVVYWRPELVKVLLNHRRRETGYCYCCCPQSGPGARTWAEHVADEYEREAKS